MRAWRARPLTAALLLFLAPLLHPWDAAGAEMASSGRSPQSQLYAVDFVATAATGMAMNGSGDVIGSFYNDNGCGPWCLPPLQTVVWRGTTPLPLPPVSGLPGITVRSINSKGWVAGFAGFPGTTTHAVLWKPTGGIYSAIDLGVLPGTTSSEAVGIDDQGRVIGWSTTLTFPPSGTPFMWSERTGMLDLFALGFPGEAPLAISRGGTVATPGFWYRLGDTSSVQALPSPPQGFYPPGNYATAINDAGDQARLLVSTGPQNLAYLFRFHHEGVWQQLSPSGSGSSTPYGVGSITSARDVTATIVGNATIAYGPSGLAQSLTPLLSAAYQGASVLVGGPITPSGRILAQVLIGRSRRLVRLTPIQACTYGCIRVSGLQLRANFIEDPNNPGLCIQNGQAYNAAWVKVVVTNDAGARLGGVQVRGRLMDDYWTNAPFAGTTDINGEVTFSYSGQCGVGAIAFLVDSVSKGLASFDRATGVLTRYAIPRVPPGGTILAAVRAGR